MEMFTVIIQIVIVCQCFYLKTVPYVIGIHQRLLAVVLIET